MTPDDFLSRLSAGLDRDDQRSTPRPGWHDRRIEAMTDTTAPVWGVWSTEWILDGTFTDSPPLEAINGRILTLDRDGHREAWKVAGGQLTEIPSRLCSLCREKPVGRGGQMCPECRGRVAHTAATDPYGRTEEEAK